MTAVGREPVLLAVLLELPQVAVLWQVGLASGLGLAVLTLALLAQPAALVGRGLLLGCPFGLSELVSLGLGVASDLLGGQLGLGERRLLGRLGEELLKLGKPRKGKEKRRENEDIG